MNIKIVKKGVEAIPKIAEITPGRSYSRMISSNLCTYQYANSCRRAANVLWLSSCAIPIAGGGSLLSSTIAGIGIGLAVSMRFFAKNWMKQAQHTVESLTQSKKFQKVLERYFKQRCEKVPDILRYQPYALKKV